MLLVLKSSTNQAGKQYICDLNLHIFTAAHLGAVSILHSVAPPEYRAGSHYEFLCGCRPHLPSLQWPRPFVLHICQHRYGASGVCLHTCASGVCLHTCACFCCVHVCMCLLCACVHVFAVCMCVDVCCVHMFAVCMCVCVCCVHVCAVCMLLWLFLSLDFQYYSVCGEELTQLCHNVS